MTISICRRFSFAYAHKLPEHGGLCKNLHGHNAVLEIEISGKINEKTGMVADFKQLKDLVNLRVINILDHSYLNDVVAFNFPSHCPTAENLIIWIVQELQAGLMFTDCNLCRVRFWETDSCYAEWREE